MTSLSIPDPAPATGAAATDDGQFAGATVQGVGTIGEPRPGARVVAEPLADEDPVESYHLMVDGGLHAVTGVWFGASLLSVLRDTLGITAVKDACEQGRCGSCSVLVGGRLVNSCLVLAADATGALVTTAAGLDDDGPASAVREALLAHGAVQCGFCTPGFVVAVTDLLDRRAAAGPDDPVDADGLREMLSGNVCRCTGYGRIVAAVQELVADTAAGGDG